MAHPGSYFSIVIKEQMQQEENQSNDSIETLMEVNEDAQGFSRFGVNFQEKIMQAMIVDHRWAAQIFEVFVVDYYEVNYLKFLAQHYFDYYKEYKTFPSLEMFISYFRQHLRKTEADIALARQITVYLNKVRKTPSLADLQYVKDKALDFCKRQALKGALEKSVELIAHEKYESVVDTIKTAIYAGSPTSIGHDFENDLEARLTPASRITVPTGIPNLDEKYILNGGHGNGELGIVVAPSGVGKTHFLIQVAANAIRHGKNVAYISLELAETAVGLRFDSNLCDVNINEIMDHKELVKQHYIDHKDQYGRLYIKQFPMNYATVGTIRSYLERLMLVNFKPDILVIDYADIMRSSQQYDAPRFELKKIYEELKAFSVELNIPIWSASQSNREGAKENIVGMENMAEAYGKAAPCDLIIGLSRKQEEKASGMARMFVAKNRNGRDGLLYDIHIDTATSKFIVVESESNDPEQRTKKADMSNAEESKKFLRNTWNKIQKDGELNLQSIFKKDDDEGSGSVN